MIVVVAGTNGAGKSSVVGTYLRNAGWDYYNPDEMARAYVQTIASADIEAGNQYAWNKGFEALQQAIIDSTDYNFETTLGGQSITQVLINAAKNGTKIRMFYVGLTSVELHIERVQARVSSGGHDIPEDKIRARFDASRKNLIALLPFLQELLVFDNSQRHGKASRLLHVRMRKIEHISPIQEIPEWAKPILMQALTLFGA